MSAEYASTRQGRKRGRAAGRDAQSKSKQRKTTAATSGETSGDASPAVALGPGGEQVTKVPVYMVKRFVVVAKLCGEKPAEGRLESSIRGLPLDSQGGLVKYLCGKDVYSFRVLSMPQVHDSIWAGVQKVGWKNLMPWAGGLEGCVQQYCSFFAKCKLNLDQARTWDRDTRVSRFVTWFDRQDPECAEAQVVDADHGVDIVVAVRGYVFGVHRGSSLSCPF